MSTPKLNIAGRLAQTFITSKLTIVFIIGVALMGVIAILQTPREENPQIVVPGAMVTVMLPGASAAEVESLIVTPLEGILSELPGVDHTAGIAQNSVGMVQVQFKVGEPKEESSSSSMTVCSPAAPACPPTQERRPFARSMPTTCRSSPSLWPPGTMMTMP